MVWDKVTANYTYIITYMRQSRFFFYKLRVLGFSLQIIKYITSVNSYSVLWSAAVLMSDKDPLIILNKPAEQPGCISNTNNLRMVTDLELKFID